MTNYDEHDMQEYEFLRSMLEHMLFNFTREALRVQPLFQFAVGRFEELAAIYCLPSFSLLIEQVDQQLDALSINPDEPIPFVPVDDNEDDDNLSPYGTINGHDPAATDDPARFRSFPHHAPRDAGLN